MTTARSVRIPRDRGVLSQAQGQRSTRSGIALLLVDVINDLDFPGSGPLVKAAESMAEPLTRLAARAREARVPVIYVNDNFGRWRSDWRNVVERCLKKSAPGHRVVQRLRPEPDDFLVLKPKHSGFYSTPLDILLRYLGVRTVILAGIATDICILFTANDAYLRDYQIVVPRDCVAANTRQKTEFALRQIKEVLKGSTPVSRRIRFGSAPRGRGGLGRTGGTVRRVIGSA